jgi:hypothetical protein
MNRGVIVIPTYNEIDNIEVILKKIFELELGVNILININMHKLYEVTHFHQL